MQLLAVEAAVVAEYLPAPQFVQDADPTPENFPAMQSMQVLAVEAAVVEEYLPTPQFAQDLDPVSGAYWPLGQAVHSPPLP